ncbi:MAG: very short patch repair endonuclease [Gemmatimonadales bacterium]|jgi:DNA mismatch endonuclease (patch repair protein)
MADNLTPEQRSYMMSRVRSTDTAPELRLRQLVHARGLRFRKNYARLPGRPDLVFVRSRVAVFVDGDYWHGWRFPTWKDKIAPYWRQKIEGNRRRDRRVTRQLRKDGWMVVRVWEHEVERNGVRCVDRVVNAVRRRLSRERGTTGRPRRLRCPSCSAGASVARRTGRPPAPARASPASAPAGPPG